MAKKKPDAQTWFRRADSFHYCGQLLLLQEKRSQVTISAVALPCVVLQAFATEAYLKSLIMLEGKDPPEIHNLLKLFDALELDSKKQIHNWGEKVIQKGLKLLKKQSPGASLPKTLRGALNRSAEAFVDFRYRPEDEPAEFTIMHFPMLVRRLILERKPEFKPNPDPFPEQS